MTNLELMLTKKLYHCYYFRSMKYVCVTCSVTPFTAVTTIWQLEVITDTAICQISIFRRLNTQCTYSENSTPIGLRLLGLPVPSWTIARLLRMYFMKKLSYENSKLKYNFKLNSC